MDREWGAPDALAFVRRTDFAPSAIAFDAAMQKASDAMQASASTRREGRRRRARDRRRDARLRLHGQGARERLPDAVVHGLAAAAAAAARLDRRPRRGGGRRGGAPLRLRALRHRLARARRRPGRPALRQRRAEQPARRADDRRRRGGQARLLREAARPHGRRELRDVAARRSDRRRAHDARSTTASCRPSGSRAQMLEAGELGRRPPLPRPLSAGVGHDDRATPGGSTRTRPAPARSATSART